jgi:tyrosinase
VPLGAGPVTAAVRLDAPSVAVVAKSLAAAPQMPAGGEPDRVFLKLENIRSPTDAAMVKVYAGLPDGADPAQHPEAYVGAISMFGVSKASRADGGRAGNGLSQTFEITHIVDALHQAGQLANLKSLNVRFVPKDNLEPGEGASVGRVSLLRRPA